MKSETAVFDAGPLIAFHQTEQLEILSTLFVHSAIPPAVAREVAPSVSELPEWIEVRHVQTIPTFTHKLGAGERESIALALQLAVDFVVLDDRRARAATRAVGLKVIGSLGLLVRAKRGGLISEVRPLMDAMIEKGLFVSERVYRRNLELAEENG